MRDIDADETNEKTVVDDDEYHDEVRVDVMVDDEHDDQVYIVAHETVDETQHLLDDEIEVIDLIVHMVHEHEVDDDIQYAIEVIDEIEYDDEIEVFDYIVDENDEIDIHIHDV